MKRGLILAVSLLFLIAGRIDLYADHRQHLFEQGNQAYQKGNYEKAIQSYEEILKMGYENADLYYNLGNAYYKSNKISKAILNYERALRLRPHDEDIQFNLQIANLSVVDKIPRIPELFYLKYFRQFRSLFSLRTLTGIALCLYLFLIASLILWLLSRNSNTRRIFKVATFCLLVFFVGGAFTLVSKIVYFQHNIEAIVMTPRVDVLSAPSEDGTQIFTIHEGLKVKVTDRQSDWYEIRLPDGKEGWLHIKDVEVI